MRRVRDALITGQLNVDRAYLETHHHAGLLIDVHLALHEGETGRGTQTMRRLARDLDFEESLPYRCLRFARTCPCFAARRNLF